MKKLLLFIAVISFIFLGLTSCNDKGSAAPSGDAVTDDNKNENVSSDSFIYTESSELSVIYDIDRVSMDALSNLRDALYDKLSIARVTFAGLGAETEHEIVIGETDRAISQRAYQLLGRVNKENEKDIAYLIYTDGNSIAIAYEEDKYETYAAHIVATEYLVENVLVGSSLTLKSGIIKSGCFNVIDWQ